MNPTEFGSASLDTESQMETKLSYSERLVGPRRNILCHMLRDRALARKFGPEAGPEIWHGGWAGNVAR